MQSTECDSSTEDLAATPSNVATRSTKRKSRVEETEAMGTSSHPQVENQAVEPEEMKEATNGAEKEEETLEKEVSDTEEEIRQGQEVAMESAPLTQSSRAERWKQEFLEWLIREFEPDDETPDLEVTGEAGEQEEAGDHSVVAGQESVPVAGRAELEVPQSPLSWLCKYVKYRDSFIVDSQMQEGASDPSDPSETQEERHALETEPGAEEREAGTQRALAGQESVPVAGGDHYSLSCLCKFIIYGDSLVVDFSDPSEAELVDAIAAVQFLMDKFEVDLVCVVKSLLKNSGDFQAAQHYLHTGRRADGRPLWTRHDDLALQSGDPATKQALILKYGEEDVARRGAFFSA
ncbi:telomeric repeat-binding factor 2-interacting protein 1-like [Acipenser ruthenus]|uniref:telomeric repeat-binding factor 2-interacting protein 1-like n=1 Tax=Acipenser ruthenus TaxID=7906 RepID=UPI002741EF81|nr:telomeric repeat-binding factor 2-interacting protein 1-like [Acipenser ruthenus]